jgi:hypothetical protein
MGALACLARPNQPQPQPITAVAQGRLDAQRYVELREGDILKERRAKPKSLILPNRRRRLLVAGARMMRNAQ